MNMYDYVMEANVYSFTQQHQFENHFGVFWTML